jgi:cell wall-associated NlpC family hydrolase
MRRRSYKVALLAVLIALLSGCASFTSNDVSKSLSSPTQLPDFSKDSSAGLDDISVAAVSLIGTPYRWGGNTPQSGFDCSGLVGYVVQVTRKKRLPRTTTDLGQYGTSLNRQTPAPGDLVFFNTLGDAHSHVGIYVGQGRFVHFPSTGGTVRIDEIKNPYWATRYTEARRVVVNN